MDGGAFLLPHWLIHFPLGRHFCPGLSWVCVALGILIISSMSGRPANLARKPYGEFSCKGIYRLRTNLFHNG